MIDFAEALAANPPRPSWTRDVALTVARALVEDTSLAVDWDRDAGEDWISLLGEDTRVGIVSVSRPLVVLTVSEKKVVERAAEHPVGVVLVPSFSDPVLMGDEGGSPFTADDLWFSMI